MDAAAHYRHLLSLGRDEFLAAAAPAVLVRFRAQARNPPASRAAALAALALDQDVGETVDGTLPHGKFTEEATEMELYPLAKKPGASFPDRITIGRTLHNDIVISEPSVSRLHAYVRLTDGWVIADAGSKNGSWLGDRELEPRREAALASGTVLRLGDIQLTFYLSSDLFDRQQGGDHGSR